jgi:hypothetical protein
MTERWKIALAQAIAQILGLGAMDRSGVVRLLRDGGGISEEQANEVIAYGLAHALLAVHPTDATQLHGTPKSPQRR